MARYLVTGSAGFIGSKIAEFLLERGDKVVGVDNFDPYYDLKLKEYRVEKLRSYRNFEFYKVDITDKRAMLEIFSQKIDGVFNLAAKAGVRYSILEPEKYYKVNVLGLLNILELMKENNIKNIVHASTSSVYAGKKLPFKEDMDVSRPISPYAASKKASEELLYSYYHLYNINSYIVRYFTVYGPAGRPDMSLFIFTDSILNNKTITIYGDGTQERSFTYIDDIARGSIKAMDVLEERGGYEIINLGSEEKHRLDYVLNLIEKEIGNKAKIQYKEFHKADMKATLADIDKAKTLLNWKPYISIEEGVKRLVSWFKNEWLKR